VINEAPQLNVVQDTTRIFETQVEGQTYRREVRSCHDQWYEPLAEICR
jgi:hypothetical protein